MTIIKIRRDTDANFTSSNLVLSDGERVFVTDLNLYKIGDGSTSYIDLPYDNYTFVETGWRSGTMITPTGGNPVGATTVDIASGTVLINDYSAFPNNNINVVNYAGVSGLAPDTTGFTPVNYFYVLPNGTLEQSLVFEETGENARNKVYIGAIFIGYDLGTGLVNLISPINIVNFDAEDFEKSNIEGFLKPNGTGLEISGNADLTFQHDSGQLWGHGINAKNSMIDPNIYNISANPLVSFSPTFRDATNADFIVAPQTTGIEAGVYDDGSDLPPTAVVPTGSVSTNNWTVHYIYVVETDFFEAYFLQYGQNVYSSSLLAEALGFSENASSTNMYFNPAVIGLRQLGAVAVRGGATDLSNPADAVWSATGIFNKYKSLQP